MSTTLQHVIATLQGSGLLPTTQINGGITDNLKPPYFSVVDYQHVPRYDTCAEGRTPPYCILDSTFKILVVHNGCDNAETLAAQIDAFVNMNVDLTPNTKAVFQTGYTSSQDVEKLYQWIVLLEYKLHESF